MAAPGEIVELVDRFDRNLDAYRSGHYNEAQIRREFIDPFFETLGWDVQNKQGYAEAYKDVIHEDAIKVGGATKAPDYCFRIGGTRKFFVEAKKPSVDIRQDVHPAYQLRRYAWSAKLPLSILTDFEELAVYDCRVKPNRNDRASTARTIYLKYPAYADRWEEIASVFARDAVLKGSFDKYAESGRRKRGTAEVDAAFLQEIEAWREQLARNFALRNAGLSRRDLNFAVQRTIDRIIFLRMCEDRGIEQYGQLQALRNGPRIYRRLGEVFRRADERYNSGLFHFMPEKGREPPDELTLGLHVDDKPLKDILGGLYYPECPYEFSVLPPEILGHVYEQFLGKVIRLTKGHRAVVEEKPEVKKAGGVYYTPTYIVDYIVANTVGKLLGGSGLGDGVSGLGSGPAGTEEGADHGVEDVSGVGRVAEGHGPRRGGVSAQQRLPRGGEVRPDQPGSPGGGLDPDQHSGGLRQDASGGLSSPPVDGQGLADGGRDPADHRRSAQAGDPSAGQGNLGSGPAGRPHAHQTHRLPQTPTRKPETPNPKPQPLTPKQAARLRILDPACGSGSFLLGAYQYLLDWHRDWYSTHEPNRWLRGRNPRIYEVARGAGLGSGVSGLGSGGSGIADGGSGIADGGAGIGSRVSGAASSKPDTPNPKPYAGTRAFRLTTPERKRILLNNIYGVDIDPQAVEVTKLSLLLKVLEGESQQTLESQLRLFHERALPDLGNNIKCGNSLIGPDFYEGKQLDLFDEEEVYRINAFDWHAEFPEVFKQGGFDVVIGNPPWGGDIDRELGYFHAQFPLTTQDHTDSFKLFIDRAIQLSGNLVSMIVPNTLLRQRRIRDVRSLMLRHQILSLVELGEDVFKGVVAPSCVYLLRKGTAASGHEVSCSDLSQVRTDEKGAAMSRVTETTTRVKQDHFLANPDLEFMGRLQPTSASVVPLGRFDDLQCKDAGINYQRVGVGMRVKGKSDLADRLLYEGKRERPIDKMFWKGSDIDRFWIAHETSRFCRPDYEHFIRRNEVVRLNEAIYMAVPKILLRQTADHLIATLDCKGVWFGRSIIAIIHRRPSAYRIQYFLGLLNSRYFDHLYRALVRETGRVFAQVKLAKLKQLPIRPIDFSNKAEKAAHDRMAELADRMLGLHRQLAEAKTGHDKTVIQRQIEATDREIDQLVYELYGLTDEEIRIVEESTS